MARAAHYNSGGSADRLLTGSDCCPLPRIALLAAALERIPERAAQTRINRAGLSRIASTNMNVSTFAIKAALIAAIVIGASSGIAEARGGGGGGGHGGGFGGGHAGGGFGGHGIGGGFAAPSFGSGLMSGRSVGFAHQGVVGGIHHGFAHRGARGYAPGYGYGYPCTYDYADNFCDYDECCY